jgi:hypothetical protein
MITQAICRSDKQLYNGLSNIFGEVDERSGYMIATGGADISGKVGVTEKAQLVLVVFSRVVDNLVDNRYEACVVGNNLSKLNDEFFNKIEDTRDYKIVYDLCYDNSREECAYLKPLVLPNTCGEGYHNIKMRVYEVVKSKTVLTDLYDDDVEDKRKTPVSTQMALHSIEMLRRFIEGGENG